MKEFVISVVGLTLVLLIARSGFDGLFTALTNIIAALVASILLLLSYPARRKEDFGAEMFALSVMIIFFSWLFIKIDFVSWFI